MSAVTYRCRCPIKSQLRGPTHAHDCPLFSTGQEAATGIVTGSSELVERVAEALARDGWRMRDGQRDYSLRDEGQAALTELAERVKATERRPSWTILNEWRKRAEAAEAGQNAAEWAMTKHAEWHRAAEAQRDEAMARFEKFAKDMAEEIKKRQTERDELLEALRVINERYPEDCSAGRIARAAIAKVTNDPAQTLPVPGFGENVRVEGGGE